MAFHFQLSTSPLPMPCNDVTEILYIELDHDDQLIDYTLHKRTCGGAVGHESLLKDWVEAKNGLVLSQLSIEKFLSSFTMTDLLDEFMRLKHFLALQSGLKIFFGQEKGNSKNPTILREVSYGKTVELYFELKIDILTEKIQACGRCVGCGTKKEVTLPKVGLPIV